MSPSAKQADKHRVISVALLNNHINPNVLKTLSTQLKNKFKYFEILLLNPIIEQDSINKYYINSAKKDSEFNNKKDSETFIKSQINKNNNENQELTNVTPPPPFAKM